MDKKFNSIPLKIKSITDKSKKGYRIFTDKTNFTDVEANSAYEAIEKSGIKNPLKIEVAGIVHKSIFTESELVEQQIKQENPSNPV